MASKEEDEKRKRKRKHKKEKREKKKRKRRSYSSSSSSDSSDSEKRARYSRKKKKSGKKRKQRGPPRVLTVKELGLMGLKHWNGKQLNSGDSQYELVRVLRSNFCGCFKKGVIQHVNFEAKPASSSDDQIQLFFAELKEGVDEIEPHVTLCCPLQVTAPLDGSGGGSVVGAMSSLADAHVCDTVGTSGSGSGDGSGGSTGGGSGDSSAGHRVDGSGGGLEDGLGDDSSTDDGSSDDGSSSDDGVIYCRFCLPAVIHPPRGFDIGRWQHYIVRNSTYPSY